MLSNQCPHRDQTRIGSDQFRQIITCRTCQKTLMVLWEGVDSSLADRCMGDAGFFGIYRGPKP
eukprot:11221163-Prorocentrum_lima.AAC.1